MNDLLQLMLEVPGYEVQVSRPIDGPVEIIVRNRLRSGTGLQTAYTFQMKEPIDTDLAMDKVREALKLMKS